MKASTLSFKAAVLFAIAGKAWGLPWPHLTIMR